MTKALELDLQKLNALAFDRTECAGDALRRYHAAKQKLNAAVAQQLRLLYRWMFVPYSLWPLNIQNVLEDCLTGLEKGKGLTTRHRLLIELLPEPPNEIICAAVTDHELHIHKGTYENLITTQAKYFQNELAIQTDPLLRRQWARIKEVFDIKAFSDHKGVIRRTMSVERNLRPSFCVDMRRREEAFQAIFDAFCLRWNLYGMQNDKPLPLKLTVNITAYGTMIHIPAYWSFDPKRDIRWAAIANLHRKRVRGRQGAALARGVSERMYDAEKLRSLDKEVLRLRLKGEKKHEFLCAGLGWDSRTSTKRISRLRAEFKNRR
jgi:hypothetical protein